MRPPKSHIVREVTLVALCGLAAACTDHNLPSAPESTEPSPFTSELVACQVDVRGLTLSCGAPRAVGTGPGTATLSADVILGGQGTYVQLSSSNVGYDAPAHIFHADVTVQNLTALTRSEEHTSELQSRLHLVCRLLLEKKKKQTRIA